jgi:hypothetical protein
MEKIKSQNYYLVNLETGKFFCGSLSLDKIAFSDSRKLYSKAYAKKLKTFLQGQNYSIEIKEI